MNICGCLVSVARDDLRSARTAMERMAGVEIHAETEDGRLVVVVEDTDEAYASDTIMALHQVQGVYALTLNYHHFEDPSQRAPLAASQPET
ncbi:chaperone NapD [uncultured Cohaesibacter sp.]|uniref:chaperone NapD n=1 Tax=uncultured Cohaesibacter sp. TaxID=1002546 RepID=UPI0029C7D763|nr:chaperone NapD [uncultured Cohaesibacter sp.]